MLGRLRTRHHEDSEHWGPRWAEVGGLREEWGQEAAD